MMRDARLRNAVQSAYLLLYNAEAAHCVLSRPRY